MMKARTVFVCQECGHRSLKWLGKCPSCGAWGTLIEEFVHEVTTQPVHRGAVLPIELSNAPQTSLERLYSGIEEFDRVMGGGIVPGSVTVIGGDPGVGKSTLMLQLCARFSSSKPLYVTGEESLDQIRYRAERLGIEGNGIAILTEQAVEDVLATIESYRPGLVVIDSIQTLYGRDLESLPGSIGQVRYCAAQLVGLAKKAAIPMLLVGHVTKEGMLAGPKVVEHMVDVVVQFEGEGTYTYRILRAVKNRYGSTNEIGIFEMNKRGLEAVDNPSRLFLTKRSKAESGVAVTAVLEGSRALLVEIQALVTQSGYGTPQRVATGYDSKRLQMLLAVLERHVNLNFLHHDVFVNVAGGLTIRDPGADIAVCAAIVSSLHNTPILDGVASIAEVGLTGELRTVAGMDMRLNEARKLGFRIALVPSSFAYSEEGSFPLLQAESISEALRQLL